MNCSQCSLSECDMHVLSPGGTHSFKNAKFSVVASPYVLPNLNSPISPSGKQNPQAYAHPLPRESPRLPSPVQCTWVLLVSYTSFGLPATLRLQGLEWKQGQGTLVVAGAEWFWKPNKPHSFEGTRKASFRYQAKKDQSWGGQARLLSVRGSKSPEGSPTSFTAKQMRYIWEATIN